MTVGELIDQIGAPIEDVLAALYQVVRTDSDAATITILNPGCTPEEIDTAEERIGRRLHPLHRILMALSNGGTLPYVSSIDLFAAAISRERQWNWLGPPPPSEVPTFDGDAAYGPFEPLVLGESLTGIFGPYSYHELDLDSLIVIALDDGGDCYGYVRGEPERIDFAGREFGRGIEAPDFERFIRDQLLFSRCASSEFIERVCTVLREE